MVPQCGPGPTLGHSAERMWSYAPRPPLNVVWATGPQDALGTPWVHSHLYSEHFHTRCAQPPNNQTQAGRVKLMLAMFLLTQRNSTGACLTTHRESLPDSDANGRVISVPFVTLHPCVLFEPPCTACRTVMTSLWTARVCVAVCFRSVSFLPDE